MNLKHEIEQLLWLPATVNELAAILEADRKIVSSTLHNLKKQGKARRIGTKWEDSTCRGRPCQRRMSIWGRPTMKHIGWIDTNKPARFRGVISTQAQTDIPTPSASAAQHRNGLS